jgi:hypothetical protein
MIEVLALLALSAPFPVLGHSDSPTAIESSAQDAMESRRILRLASGQSIRVLSRWRDGAWEYKGRSGWDRLDPRAVTGAELEADVLRAWRAELAQRDAKDLAARCRLAQFAADRGLATEALAELDAVLGVDPDHAAALTLLRNTWLVSVPTLDVPAEQEGAARAELLRFGSSLPPAGREIAIQQIALAQDREALHQELARDLWSSIVVRRSFAALALQRIFPGEQLQPLLVHAVRDSSQDVRRASSRALRGAADPAVVLPLTRALRSPSLAIRSNAAAALGEVGYPAAVEPLIASLALALQSSTDARAPHANIFIGRQIAYVQDFDVEVAQFQAVADPRINVLIEGSTLDAAVISSREEGVEVEVVAIRRALEQIVGERPGGTGRDWLRWWEKQSAKWRAADHSRPATRSGD